MQEWLIDHIKESLMGNPDRGDLRHPYLNKEMRRLRAKLDEAGIPWADSSDDHFCRTRLAVGDTLASVVYGRGSYGKDEGLLEVWINTGDDTPEGGYTADEILEKLIGEENIKRDARGRIIELATE